MSKRKQKKKEEGLGAAAILIIGFLFVVTQSIGATILLLMLIGIAYGIIVFLIGKKKKEKLKKSGIHDIDQMDGFQFEYYLEQLFKSHGYRVTVTSSRGDFGADLILHSKEGKIAVQAKRYKKSVGIKAVQEIVAAKDYYNASSAWVVTNSEFTKPAVDLADRANVRLINRKSLIDLILHINPNGQEVAEKTIKEVKAKSIPCKQCGGRMIVKEGKFGNFYGCTKFPGCKHTKAL